MWEKPEDPDEPTLLPQRKRRRRKRKATAAGNGNGIRRLKREDRHALLTIALAVAMGTNGFLALQALSGVPFLLTFQTLDVSAEHLPSFYQNMAQPDDGGFTCESLNCVVPALIAWFMTIAVLRATLALSWMALYFFWRPGLVMAIVTTAVVSFVEGFLGDGSFAMTSVALCVGIVAMLFRLQPVTWSLYRPWNDIFRERNI